MNINKKRFFSIFISVLFTAGLFLPFVPINAQAADSADSANYVSFKYDDFGTDTPQDLIALNGVAGFIKNEDNNKDVLRLTSSKNIPTGQTGSGYYKNYISLSNHNRSFSTFFSFSMSHPDTNPKYGGGDGLVFVINNNTNSLGQQGGGMGYQGINNSIGIEFDSYDNGTGMGDTGLGKDHIAVSVNGDLSKPVATAKNSTFGDFVFQDGRSYYVWVDYDGTSHDLQVRINDSNDRANAYMAIDTSDVNLGDDSIFKDNNVYAGFSAGTAGAYENHDIESWYFYNDYAPTDTASNDYTQLPTKVELSANPSSDTTSSEIKAKVTNPDGSVAANIPVSFSIVSGNGTLDNVTAITDANGIASVNLSDVGVAPGSYPTIKAEALGGSYDTVEIDNSGITVPGAPTNVSAAARNASALLRWNAPADNGGSDITGYKVNVCDKDGNLLKTVDTGSTGTSYIVSGLKNGTHYTFTVVASNSLGDSVPSDRTNTVTPAAPIPPATVPGAPANVNAAAGNAGTSLSWSAPAYNGGKSITGYKINVCDKDGNLLKTVDTGTADTSYTVSGLTNGTPYTFTVVASNSVGDSVPSDRTGAVIPIAVPGIPTDVSAAAGNTSASLSWSAPVDNGGSAITDYKVNVCDKDGKLLKTMDTGSTGTSYTVSDLENGTHYTFTVVASNSVGDSEPSDRTGTVTPAVVPGAPTDVSAASGNASASLSWKAPVDNGGSAVIGYKINICDKDGKLLKTVDTGSAVSSYTVPGLTNGTPYTFTVVASNLVGDSEPSDRTGAIIPAAVPGVPTDVNAAAGNTSASLSWKAPADNGGSAVTDYKVNVCDKDGKLLKTVDTGSAGTSYTVSDLENGTAYTFTVVASNSVGDSAPSDRTGTVTPKHSSSGGGGGSGSSSGKEVEVSVVDPANNDTVASPNAKVTTNTNNTKNISIDSSDVVLLKQEDGKGVPFKDYSRIGYIAPEGTSTDISSSGNLTVKNLAESRDYDIPITYDMGSSQKIIIGSMHISVDGSGNVSMTSDLIDPYGKVTDSVSGSYVEGAEVTLYYADTERNKSSGKTPDTAVELPSIDGFEPADNQNPQLTNSSGDYGFMVYPNTDYYIVVSKDGYDTYTSRTIPVGDSIVKYSVQLNLSVEGVKRISGNNRIDTSIELAKAGFSGKIKSIIFAAASNYPDGLTGSVLAYQQNAPIILVGNSQEDKNKVLSYMKNYLENDGHVFILGGTGVVDDNFANQVKAAGCSNITRLGGANRYETSLKIAKYLDVAEGTPVIIASGENYPDALSVSSVAATNQYPILLVSSSMVSDSVKNELADIKPEKIYIIGGQGVVKDSVKNQIAQSASLNIANITRIGGADRYATSVDIANGFKPSGKNVCIAAGTNFPDALSGSIYAAKYNAPVLLAKGKLTDEEISYIKNHKISGASVFGGEGVVNNSIMEQLNKLLSK